MPPYEICFVFKCWLTQPQSSDHSGMQRPHQSYYFWLSDSAVPGQEHESFYEPSSIGI